PRSPGEAHVARDGRPGGALSRQAEDALDQGGLAGPRRAFDRDDLAAPERELRDAQAETRPAHGDVLDLEERGVGHASGMIVARGDRLNGPERAAAGLPNGRLARRTGP